MISLAPETIEALKQGRVRWLVFFDFMFTPMRLHCGDGAIKWEGHDWNGAGTIIRTALSASTTLIASSVRRHGGHHKGELKASLPLDDATREVLDNDYYGGRRMELFLCSLDAHGKIIERVFYAAGSITDMRIEENSVAVIAKDDTFDSIGDKDARHAIRVKGDRAWFRVKLSHAVPPWLARTLAGTIAIIVGSWAEGILILEAALALFRRKTRRAVAQRWQAKKRTYWFITEPNIPYKLKRKKGYRIRADTLEEAQQALGVVVARRIWWVPRGWLKMLVWVDGRWVEDIDLDKIRQASDPEKWKATDPVRQWGRKE